jgi:1-acyl-sn-glycerol-3-phosphate acyltransferase
MFDIPAIGWAFRAYRPKYIAKSGLKNGIPSISYNIRNGGSTTVKLNAPKEAVTAIKAFGKEVYERKDMAVIFPEGARSRNGVPREFKATGLKVLLENMPNAVVIPVVLHNFWKFERYRCKPVPFGTHKHLHMLTPITDTHNIEEVVASVGDQINQKLLELNGISNWDSYK